MLKQIIVIFIILSTLFVSQSSSQQCTGQADCVGEGQTCNFDQYYNTKTVGNTNGTTCNGSFYCSKADSSFKCKPIVKVGSHCTSSEQCMSLYCNSQECKELAFASVGQSCSNSNQCYSMGTTLKCGSSGTCVSASIVAGQCTDSSQCAYNKYCLSGACVSRKSVGSVCVYQEDCIQGLQCINHNGTRRCTAAFSQPLGGNCSFGVYDTCAPPYICNRTSNVCIEYPTSLTNSSCTTNSQCTSQFQTCACQSGSTTTGTCQTITPKVSQDCVTKLLAYYSCVNAHGCSMYPTPGIQSCQIQNCVKEFCDTYQCNFGLPDCGVSGVCLFASSIGGGGQSSSSTLTVSPLSILFLLSISILYLFK